MTAVPLALLAAAVAGLLAAEARDSVWRYFAKPTASCCFIWIALAAGAARSTYGRAILVALCLSWLGDVLLLGSGQLPFTAGLGSFLLAHVAFAAAFMGLGTSSPLTAAALVLLLAGPAPVVLRWVWPGVPAALRGPVLAYVGVISAMLACAVGAWGGPRYAGGNPALAACGAALFYASDICVAAERFRSGGLRSKMLGLPLYYLAQVLLACSAAVE